MNWRARELARWIDGRCVDSMISELSGSSLIGENLPDNIYVMLVEKVI